MVPDCSRSVSVIGSPAPAVAGALPLVSTVIWLLLAVALLSHAFVTDAVPRSLSRAGAEAATSVAMSTATTTTTGVAGWRKRRNRNSLWE